MLRDDFAVMILSHNRYQDRNYDTLKTLKKSGYTGKYYFVLDDADPGIDGYKKKYGEEHVLIFNKKDVIDKLGFDVMDNSDIWNLGCYARPAIHELAKSVGLKYFLEMDDDYDSFRYRFPGEPSKAFKKTFDRMVEVYLDFYIKNPQITTLCFCQGADLSVVPKGEVKRKAMNAFFCSVDRPIMWAGHFNDDVNSYIRGNQLGEIYLTLPYVQLNQEPSQTNGGAAAAYKTFGTYNKSFYSVLLCPSFVKVSTFSKGFRMSKFRLHHKIDSIHGVAQILSSRWKKK